jgi:hypothetical protein
MAAFGTKSMTAFGDRELPLRVGSGCSAATASMTVGSLLQQLGIDILLVRLRERSVPPGCRTGRSGDFAPVNNGAAIP